MSDRKQKQGNSSGAVFATAAAVGIGALAAFGGYMFGKYQTEEEVRQEQQNRSTVTSNYVAPPPNQEGPDFEKRYEKECIICMRAFEEVKYNNVALVTTPCGHIFCRDCIADALLRKEECPVCRGPVELQQTLRVFL